MMKTLRDILLFLSVCLLIGVAACDNNGCEENQSSLPLAGFYSSQTKSSISIDSLTVYGIGAPGDSAVIRCETGVSQVYLPFDIDADTSRFVFKYEQLEIAELGITDTVEIVYESRPYFHSKDCGAMYVFDVEGHNVTHNLIDSIQIPVQTIDNTNTEFIRIFFRTEEADEE